MARPKKYLTDEESKSAQKENIRRWIKNNPEYMSEWNRKYKEKKENAIKKKIEEILSTNVFGVYENENGKKYYVSIDGKEVYNYRGRKLKITTLPYGYKMVSPGLLHRVVWMAFNGDIPDGYEIDHIIPIKNGGTDELSNLRCATHPENCNNPISIENYKMHNKEVDRSYLKKSL